MPRSGVNILTHFGSQSKQSRCHMVCLSWRPILAGFLSKGTCCRRRERCAGRGYSQFTNSLEFAKIRTRAFREVWAGSRIVLAWDLGCLLDIATLRGVTICEGRGAEREGRRCRRYVSAGFGSLRDAASDRIHLVTVLGHTGGPSQVCQCLRRARGKWGTTGMGDG